MYNPWDPNYSNPHGYRYERAPGRGYFYPTPGAARSVLAQRAPPAAAPLVDADLVAITRAIADDTRTNDLCDEFGDEDSAAREQIRRHEAAALREREFLKAKERREREDARRRDKEHQRQMRLAVEAQRAEAERFHIKREDEARERRRREAQDRRIADELQRAEAERFRIKREDDARERRRKEVEDRRIADELQRAEYGLSMLTTNYCDVCHVETTGRLCRMCRWARP
jgi:hypothetical protein